MRFRISEEVENDHSINNNRTTDVLNSITEDGEYGLVRSVTDVPPSRSTESRNRNSRSARPSILSIYKKGGEVDKN